MPEKTPQSFSNHAKLDPLFHYFLVPVTGVLSLYCLYLVIRHPGLVHVVLLILSACLFCAIGMTRGYSLKVQDRVIRMEERLRLMALSPEALRPRIHQLTERQLIALRFASDAEMPVLAQRALDENLDPKQIKQSIQNWRPDHWRV